MKACITLIALLTIFSSQSFARSYEGFTCLLKNQNVHVEIENNLEVLTSHIFDLKAAQFTDLQNLRAFHYNEKWISLLGEVNGQVVAINYNRQSVMPKASFVKIGDKLEKCNCYYSQYSIDDQLLEK